MNATGDQGWGVCITNDTAADYQDITVSFVGEQWRDQRDLAQSLTFAYTTSATLAAELASATLIAAPGDDHATGWFAVDALEFVSPVFEISGALDGNADANREALSHTLTDLTLAPDEVLCIRWFDENVIPGLDHGLAIDDLVVTAMTEG